MAPALIESELFGHERGAFTGASAPHRGRFERAAKGSVFLGEIGDLPLNLQTKLLRVLEERRFERVGGSRTLTMSARVIAATIVDLEARATEGRFRSDLFFRLDIMRFKLPSLRDRLQDLPGIVETGLRRLCTSLRIPQPALGDGVYEQLASHDWPGNVRELLNVLERALVGESGAVLRAETFDRVMALTGQRDSGGPEALPRYGNDGERIRAALLGSGGNVARAARRLGIPRETLRYQIERLDLGNLIPRD